VDADQQLRELENVLRQFYSGSIVDPAFKTQIGSVKFGNYIYTDISILRAIFGTDKKWACQLAGS
jgi:hypothetical protein